MQIYLDSANLGDIKKALDLGLIDGVTTNPSLVSKENCEYEYLLEQISAMLQDKPVSAEVISTTATDMIKEAQRLFKIASNIVIKIPITKEGLIAINKLSQLEIPINATLCFQPLQALAVAKLGATYVSPFVGRLEDAGEDGLSMVANIKLIFSNYNYQTKIIMASVRNVGHVLNAARIGVDIVTMPYKILEQLIEHPKTKEGLELFLKDYEKVSKL